ncbi:MAG: hypothetical protein HRU19_21245 [Pseudobacteriovorax sp.]|nr:hypothetical protein [Pseudobacteriovorax sp.]
MCHKACLLLLLIAMFKFDLILAESLAKSNSSIDMGLYVGQLKKDGNSTTDSDQIEDNQSLEEATFGGIILQYSNLESYSTHSAREIGLGTVLDFLNQQISNYHGFLGYYYLVSGGFKELTTKGKNYRITARNSHSIRLGVRIKYESFSISARNDPRTLEGNLVALAPVARYRLGSWILTIETTVISFPASTDRLKSQGISISIGCIL